MTVYEANFDGLIGPTHNYAGLSFGNVASAKNALQTANPKEAALQGLKKMKRLADLGLVQGVLPPHARPHIPTLRSLGYAGSDRDIIAKVAQTAPEVLYNIYAAAPMWTANAATIAPSSDTADAKLHLTLANLAAMFHRSIEHETTARVLKAIFADEALFAHHPALPGGVDFGDEGAANHSRLCNDYGDNGLHLFVYGRKAFQKTAGPEKFPRRQTFEASAAIARLHGLDEGRVHYVQQNPAVIDAGAFHNDVVAVANKNTLFYHAQAFQDPDTLQQDLQTLAPDIDLHFIEVPADEVPIGDAVKSYLFNSQLISVPGDDGMTLVLPVEAKETKSTKAYLEKLISSNQPIKKVEFIDVRQSMRNGGGPACLRLRVVMSEKERENLSANVVITDTLFETLSAWVNRHYRDRLTLDDLADPALMEESFTALDELTGILELGPVYEFQTG